jgi:hypothetical protein
MTEHDFLASNLESPTAFREFVAENWNRVFQALFVYQIQPLNPLKSPLVRSAISRPDAKMRRAYLEIFSELRRLLPWEDVTMRGLAIHGDRQTDAIHSEQDVSNRHTFATSASLPSARKFPIIFHALHLLKWVRCRLTKPTLIFGTMNIRMSEPKVIVLREDIR